MKSLKLERQENSNKSSHALAGANIRKELKHKFPNCKFKVTTSSFSGGTDLRVSWFDGPTSEEIDSVINKYEYGYFNSMEDIYEYNKDHNDSYGEVKYTFSKRNYSKGAMQDAVDYCNIDTEVLMSDYDNSAYIKVDIEDTYKVNHYLNEKSLYKNSEPIAVKTSDNTSNEEIYNTGIVEDFTHTKTKEVLKVLKVAHKLTRDAFKSFKDYMKQEQGAYYSRYAKGFVLQN